MKPKKPIFIKVVDEVSKNNIPPSKSFHVLFFSNHLKQM